jgi:hypothetical protein
VVGSCRSANANLKGSMNTNVLLRNRETGHYYAGASGRHGDSSVAHDFEKVESATQFARTDGLAGMEVVVRSADPAAI